jgi:hypothetical protein
LRSEADYSISREILKGEAREIIKDAKEFLARIEKLKEEWAWPEVLPLGIIFKPSKKRFL